MSPVNSDKFSLLKMPLDRSNSVDEEVYNILKGFKSGVEAKNFLCSAVLYYARSPLVLSANALTEKLDKLVAVLEKLDFSYTGLQLEKILSKLDNVYVGEREPESLNVSPMSVMNVDKNTAGMLLSLKDRFKI